MFTLSNLLTVVLILLVTAGIAICVFVVFLLLEFIRSAKSFNRIITKSETEINSMLDEVAHTVNVTSDGIQAVVKRIKFFSAFLEVLGVVSGGVDAFKSKTKQAAAPSKIAVLSTLAGIKRAVEIILGEKK